MAPKKSTTSIPKSSMPFGGKSVTSGTKDKVTKTSTKTTKDTKGKIDALTGLTESLGGLADLVKLLGESDTSGNPFARNRSDDEYVKIKGTGTSNTGQRYIEGRLVSEEEFSKFLYGDGGKAGGTTEVSTSATEEADKKRREGQSAYTLLFEEFSRYGLGGLVEPLKGFIIEGLSPAEFTLKLRDTEAYRKRFAANQARINKGLRALSEAEYIGLEDQYQNIMRQYGLPASYYTRGDMGRQEGFEKFIGGDVSAAELEDRIQTAQNRVINAAPEVAASLRSFYPDITNGDILAYSLDPERAITDIRRKVTAAEIGGAATMAGLTTGVTRAEELGRFGVTGEQARQGFRAVAEVAPRGGQLAEFYRQGPYTQATAEQEVFGLTGATEAARQRRKLTELEQASFSGQAGAAGGALARERAGQF
jgi:hypothetical protein